MYLVLIFSSSLDSQHAFSSTQAENLRKDKRFDQALKKREMYFKEYTAGIWSPEQYRSIVDKLLTSPPVSPPAKRRRQTTPEEWSESE